VKEKPYTVEVPREFKEELDKAKKQGFDRKFVVATGIKTALRFLLFSNTDWATTKDVSINYEILKAQREMMAKSGATLEEIKKIDDAVKAVGDVLKRLENGDKNNGK